MYPLYQLNLIILFRERLLAQIEHKRCIDTLFANHKRFNQREVDSYYAMKQKFVETLRNIKLAPLNRSRIFAIGAGGSGKTSCCMTFRDLPPQHHVPSTIGVDAFTFDVSETEVADTKLGNWGNVSVEEFNESVRVVARAKQKIKDSFIVNNNAVESRIIADSIDGDQGEIVIRQSGVAVKPQFLDDDAVDDDPITLNIDTNSNNLSDSNERIAAQSLTDGIK